MQIGKIISYQCVAEDEPAREFSFSDDDWIRIVPLAPPVESVVRSSRRDVGPHRIVELDYAFDVKCFGIGDAWFFGPSMLVSDDFLLALKTHGATGYDVDPVPHATPNTPHARRPSRLITHANLTRVAEGVVFRPETHAKGRDYGFHGKPLEPLSLAGPCLNSHEVYGSPWFATASLPFQFPIVKWTFVAAFKQHIGREPGFSWEKCDVRRDDSLVLRESFIERREVPAFSVGTSSMHLDATIESCRDVAGVYRHSFVGAPILFDGAVGFFPEVMSDEYLTAHRGCRASNIPQAMTRAEANTREAVEELGYLRIPDSEVVGWVRGEMPTLLCRSAEGGLWRVSASGTVVTRYLSLDQWVQDTVEDLRWAWDNNSNTAHWFGWA